jgi:t-SNARE complex subunit (syntaxin)
MDTNQIPVEMKDVDQLPQEKAWKLDDICKMVGRLYLESHHQTEIMNEQFQSAMKHIQERLQFYVEENDRLKRELQDGRSHSGPITDGPSEIPQSSE